MMFGRRIGRMSRWTYGRISRSSCSRRSIAGKAEPERGAVTGAALDRDRASVLFKNAMADGESESGTAGPGAESRFKDARQVVRRNARPGVADDDFDAVARRALRRSAVDAANREPSAARHEAKRIEREVEQHLFEAVPVGLNGDAIETVDDLHFDARLLGERQQKAVGPVEKLAHVGRGELGLGRVVQVQYVVDGRRKRAQAGLDVFDPAAAFACEIRFSQEAGEEFEAAQGIAD